MARKFKDLVARTMTPARRASAVKRTKAMLVEMHLAELRRARELSQVDLAKRFGTTQPEISKIEARSDVYISTLRRYIEAAGGRLEIVARFSDSDVRINQFSEIGAGSR